MSLQRRALLAGFVGGLIVPQRTFAIVRPESLMRIKPVAQFDRDARIKALLRKIELNSRYSMDRIYWQMLQEDIYASSMLTGTMSTFKIPKSPNLAR